MTAPLYHGSCLCGGVTYDVTGPLRTVVACHCSQCRKTSGHYVAATQARAADLHVRGDTLQWYRSSATAQRGFCGRCGGNLFWRPDDRPVVSIFAGTIDDTGALKMTAQIYCEDKGSYYDLPDCSIVARETVI
ncbi:MAG: GFA family protein [Paracoccaceae bacterium]